MNLDSLTSILSRLSFAVALIVFSVAAVERLFNLFGFTLLRGVYSPARLLDIGVVALVLVITLLLREIRQEMRQRGA